MKFSIPSSSLIIATIYSTIIITTSNAFILTPSSSSFTIQSKSSLTSVSLSSSSQSTTSSTKEEGEFKIRTKQLCAERNLPLQKVKNARDLSSVAHSPIQQNRIIRTGRVSDATKDDLSLLLDTIGIKTLVDLRSYTELKDDMTLDRKEVFGEFNDLIWDERTDVIKVLNEGRSRVEKKKNIVGHVKELVGGAKRGVDVATHFRNETDTSANASTIHTGSVSDDDTVVVDNGLLKVLTSAAELADATQACEDCHDDDDDDSTPAILEDKVIFDEELADHHTTTDTASTGTTNTANIANKKRFIKLYHNRNEMINDKSRAESKERHFVSIMNELKYVIGTLSKVRKRDLAKAIIKSPGAIVSKRVRSSCKEVFLSRINSGGLHMLNELLLKQGAPGIKYVLDLCKDRSRHPVAFYCTAGKDRTGMIAAIMLAAAGVADEDIVEDYSLSANVYAEMNDHKAMVGALSQRSLDAKTFLGAPPEVMRDTLVNIRSVYGSIEGYLDYIGFTEEDRKQLRAALLED